MAQARRVKAKEESFFSKYISRHLKEGLFIGVATMAAFVLLALLSYNQYDSSWSSSGNLGATHNAAGKVGAWISDVLLYLFGYIAFLIPIFVIYAMVLAFRYYYKDDDEEEADEEMSLSHILKVRSIGLVLLIFSLTSLFSLHVSASISYLPYSAGGILGSSLGPWLMHIMNTIGSGLFLFALFLGGVTFVTGLSWFKIMELLGEVALKFSSGLWGLIQTAFKRSTRSVEEEDKFEEPLFKKKSKKKAKFIEEEEFIRPPIKINKPIPPKSVVKVVKKANSETQTAGLPTLDLLDQPVPSQGTGFSAEDLTRLSRLVEQKLGEFGINAHVMGVYPGPVITRFELDLAAGTKASKLTGLSRDFARALSVYSVRIVEVIPGKSFVGLEIPNAKREMVNFCEIVSSSAYDESKSPLSLALGKDIGGQPYVVDLGRMPHLLVAGTTGAGKSVGLNAMLLSILYKSTPEMVRLIMVDPKMLELSIYDGIPHLLTPVITDMKEAANALRWCIGEMDRRYRMMAALGVRNLAGYNTKVAEGIAAKKPLVDPLWPKDNAGDAPELAHLPYLVVLVDEFADMMMVVGKKVEELITRLAQKARAAGIHLILATQRPSVDVITGLIKANVPARIAFQTSSRIDSRTILDQQGAEQLLGHGDMLYMSAGMMPTRVHGAFVGDHEVHAVVDFLKAQGEPAYITEILEGDSEIGDDGMPVQAKSGGSDVDPLFDQAVDIVAKTRRASISNVQRRLKIGYNRAATILEQMEEQGMVSSMEGNGTREVLLPEHNE
jgi:S-DNA-T family DNA segregation ATPase FtsK/SpoIIIE